MILVIQEMATKLHGGKNWGHQKMNYRCGAWMTGQHVPETKAWWLQGRMISRHCNEKVYKGRKRYGDQGF